MLLIIVIAIVCSQSLESKWRELVRKYETHIDDEAMNDPKMGGQERDCYTEEIPIWELFTVSKVYFMHTYISFIYKLYITDTFITSGR